MDLPAAPTPPAGPGSELASMQADLQRLVVALDAMRRQQEALTAEVRQSNSDSAELRHEMAVLNERVSEMDHLLRSRTLNARHAMHKFSNDLSPTGAAFGEGQNDLRPSSPAAQ